MRLGRRVLLCALACLLPGGKPAADPLPRSILVLDQSDVRGPFYHEIFAGLRSAVNASPGLPVSIYVESLDLSRFGGAQYEESLRSHFAVKYRDKPVGVVVAVGSATLDYVLRARAKLWPDVPVVFTMVDQLSFARLTPPADVTGRIMPLRFGDMMVVARAVVPGLERIAIVGDPFETQTAYRQFAEEIPAATAGIEIIDLVGLPMRELRARLAALPDRTAILYTAIYSDGEGTFYPPADALARLAPAANRPIVITAETFLGRGGIGGFVMVPAATGREAGSLALRILDGEKAAGIPITTSDAVRPIFDWRQLRRWGVDDANLPSGSEIRFREWTAWERYRPHFIAVLAAILLQSALISWLLYERQQKRRSEAASHELSGRLINAQEEERSRLARELHDDVTQRLAVLAIDAGREARALTGSAGVTAIRSMQEGLIRLSEDVHALSYRLHPSILEDLGLTEALKSECDRFALAYPIRVKVNATEIHGDPARDVALCLFRIAQEALRNVARHSGANRTEVSLRRLDGGLQLAVHDDGTGFDPTHPRAGTSLGLASMRQRAFLLGGNLEIESGPGRGTMVMAWVPLKGGST